MIGFLQNAWSPVYAGRVWPRQSWIRALARSRSGQRLKLLPLKWQDYYNVSPEVTRFSWACPAVDYDHVRAVLKLTKPDVVVTFGLPAFTAVVVEWDGPLLALPHPAYRLLTNKLLHEAAEILQGGHTGRLLLSQGRKRTERKSL